MSDAYEQEMAEERAIRDQIAAAEAPAINQGGRPFAADPIKVVAWRQAHDATIRDTAKRWAVSEASVKRWTRDFAEAAKLERRRWECEQLDREARLHEHGIWQMFNRQLARARYDAEFGWHHRRQAAKGTDQEAALEAAYEAALSEARGRFVESWQFHMGPAPEYVPPF